MGPTSWPYLLYAVRALHPDHTDCTGPTFCPYSLVLSLHLTILTVHSLLSYSTRCKGPTPWPYSLFGPFCLTILAVRALHLDPTHCMGPAPWPYSVRALHPGPATIDADTASIWLMPCMTITTNGIWQLLLVKKTCVSSCSLWSRSCYRMCKHNFH